MGAVVGAFAAVSRNLVVMQRNSDRDQVERIILDQIRRDFAGLHPLRLSAEDQADPLDPTAAAAPLPSDEPMVGVTFVGEDAQGPNGEPMDNVRFTATLGGASAASANDYQAAGRGDLAEVMYKLDLDDATPERGLLRVVNWQPGLAADETQAEVLELAPEATSFDLRYYSDVPRDGADAQGWSPDWQDAESAPAALAIRLGLTTPDDPEAEERIVQMTLRLPLRAPAARPLEQLAPPADPLAGEPGAEGGHDLEERVTGR